MTEIRPGAVHYATATKAVVHGTPAIENGFAGVALKQVPAAAGTGLGDAKITTVQIGEAFIINYRGQVYVANSRNGGGTFAKGDPVYIRTSDNALSTVTTDAKFGRVEAIAGERGVATGQMRVSLDQRDSF